VNPELPYIDEHAISIDAPREWVWTALTRFVESSLASGRGRPVTRLLGTEPPSGFEVSRSEPAAHLTLTGRHRFSRYRLVFELADAADGATQLRARTYAAFPGLSGQVYRTLVIRTRLHVLATHHLLRSIARSAR